MAGARRAGAAYVARGHRAPERNSSAPIAVASSEGLPHSHVIGEMRGGWRTVNIRVFDVNVWNEIVAAKTLEKIRELQADPAVGGAGRISRDTPTNIFFFISVQPDHPDK